ncbi:MULTISPECIES: nuclear transport factor 2 family protein [unclassified Geodermatophilus]
MSDHPNLIRMREGYEAFGKGDLDRLRELWRPDIRWHEPGDNALSGRYTGVDEVFALFGRLFEITEGSFRAEVRATFADDTDGVAVVRLTAHRGDRDIDVVAAHLFRYDEDGRVAEFQEAHTDQAAVNAFYA